MDDCPQIILASSSPRRRQLLKQIGVQFTVLPVDVDESTIDGETPENRVVRLAAKKSIKGRRLAQGQLPVIGADTEVVVDNHALGKPVDRNHAFSMLKLLSGRQHKVLTAVSIRTNAHWQALSVSTIMFRNITEKEMKAYWNTEEPLNKAGGYAIQGLGAVFATRMEGSFSGVMGLPLFETAELLNQIGIDTFRTYSRNAG